MPPAHAPAHGLRRQQEVAEGGARPVGEGAGVGKSGGGQRVGESDGAQTLEKSNEVRRTEGPEEVSKRKGSVGRATTTVTSGAAAAAMAEAEKRNEEERKKRKIADEEKLIREDDRLTRERGVRQKIQQKDERLDVASVRDKTIDEASSARRSARDQTRVEPPKSASLDDAFHSVGRATETLLRGKGADATSMLSAEAARVKDLASQLPRGSSEERVLNAFAVSLELQSEALRAPTPDLARGIADRLERVARATEARADKLASEVEDRSTKQSATVLESHSATGSRSFDGPPTEIRDMSERFLRAEAPKPSDRSDRARESGEKNVVGEKAATSPDGKIRGDLNTERIALKDRPAEPARVQDVTDRIALEKPGDRSNLKDPAESPGTVRVQHAQEKQAREVPKVESAGQGLTPDARADTHPTKPEREVTQPRDARQAKPRDATQLDPPRESARAGRPGISASSNQARSEIGDSASKLKDGFATEPKTDPARKLESKPEGPRRSEPKTDPGRGLDPKTDAARSSEPKIVRVAEARTEAMRSSELLAPRKDLRVLAQTDPAAASELLRALARETLGQAALLRAAAANTDSLVGRALARSLAVIADASVPLYFQRAEGALPKKVDKVGVENSMAPLRDALNRFDRHLADLRAPLHEALARFDPRLADRQRTPTAIGSGVSAAAAYQTISNHTLTKHLLEPLARLSEAISTSSSDGIRAAQKELVAALSERGQLGLLKSHLQQLGDATRPLSTTPAELLRGELPSLVLKGIVGGGLAASFDGSPHSAFAQRLKRISINEDPNALSASERLLVNLAGGRTPPTAPMLDPKATVWLGNATLFNESGRVLTSFLADPLNLVTKPPVEARDLERMVRLPVASGESAAFADPKGAVLVRGADGSVGFHQGFVAAGGERLYFDTQSGEGLVKVTYRRSGEADPLAVRVDVEVGEPAIKPKFEGDPTLVSRFSPLRPASVDIEDTEEVDERRPLAKGASIQAYAAVAAYSRNGSGLFLGVVPKWTARSLAGEISAMRARVGTDGLAPLMLESTEDIAFRLRVLGMGGAEPFEAHVVDEVTDLGLDPAVTGALVILSPTSSDLDVVERQLGRVGGEAALFVPADGAPMAVSRFPQDPLREYDLVEDGILIRASREAVVID